MRVRRLRIGTLEIPLEEFGADVLEVGLLRLVRGGRVEESPAAALIGAPMHGKMALSNDNLPANRYTLPGGSAYGASGTLEYTVAGPHTARLALTVSDLGTIGDNGGYYEGWLIHDLTVPVDLNPADFAALPRTPDGRGNEPGSVFTIDGIPENTVWVPVSIGRFNTNTAGWARIFTDLTPETNMTFSLLDLLGMRALTPEDGGEPPDPDSPRECRVGLIPSGMARDILTDTFMRPVTVHPGISLRNGFPKRLAIIARERMDSAKGDATIDTGFCIGIRDFNRFAVTREPGPEERAPGYVPSRRSFVLTGLRG